MDSSELKEGDSSNYPVVGLQHPQHPWKTWLRSGLLRPDADHDPHPPLSTVVHGHCL